MGTEDPKKNVGAGVVAHLVHEVTTHTHTHTHTHTLWGRGRERQRQRI